MQVRSCNLQNAVRPGNPDCDSDDLQRRCLMCEGARAIAGAVRQLYAEGETDYWLPPIVVVNAEGEPVGRIVDGDSVICCCRRGEREVQLTRAFVDPNFNEHPVKRFERLTFVPLTLYDEMFRHLPIAFPPTELKDTLGEVVARHGLKQARVAESEKFAHVTFFFNGRRNQPFPGEVDLEVPTPKGVPYSQIPELSIAEVTERATQALRSAQYHLIAVNFANGDVIGHLEDREANLRCAEAIDRYLGLLLEAAAEGDYATLITADHGVFEQMTKPDGRPSIGHTCNPVPLILIGLHNGDGGKVSLRPGGKLANVAPTALEIMGLPKPTTMTCQSLLQDRGAKAGRYAKALAQRVLLVILDGCGVGRQDESNPLFLAPTPVLDRLWRECPLTVLAASGEAVGLKNGKSGNSEAGHVNLAAGRVVRQDDVRIDSALRDGTFYKNEAFLLAIRNAKEKKCALHLLALLSKSSSHGSMEYPLGLLRLARQEGLERVFVHLIFDGRSTEPGSAPELLEEFSQKMHSLGVGRIVTGMGRGLALDRDGNYRQRTRLAYEALVFGKGKPVPAPTRFYKLK